MAQFNKLQKRMAISKIATARQLRGCSRAEIADLEARYGLKLPFTYCRYLEIMGHGSGRLFISDHMDVFYPNILEMTDDVRLRRLGCDAPGNASDPIAPASFELPKDALLIAGRLDEQWQFIRCNDQDDSPVWYFNENDWQIKQTDVSVLDWLECWCGIAEDAIASGYFNDKPAGTIP